MKHRTKKEIEKHEANLKYLKLQRKKINRKIRNEVMILYRLTDEKRKRYVTKKKKIDEPTSLSDDLITIVHKAAKNEKTWTPDGFS